MLSEEMISFTPVNFFHFQMECRHVSRKHPFNLNTQNAAAFQFPSLSSLCHERAFADVSLAWNEEGIECYVNVREPYRQSFFPEVSEGDSVELFFDTRDMKTAGFNTRFCHHFFFLPKPIEGTFAGEKTHFRTEDMHELCDPHELKTSVHFNKGYAMQVFIPKTCLHGYEPEQFDRLGFTYRINRFGEPPQHFSVLSEDFAIDQQPSLWSSVRLVS